MEICVEMWSNLCFDKKLVATSVNQFFVGLMIFLKTGQLATCKGTISSTSYLFVIVCLQHYLGQLK